MNASDRFYWAVGIENTFIPHARPGLRPLDEYELTQHYRFWREDLARAADLGISHIRWGIPWYRANPAAGRYEWGWVDEVLDYLVNVKGVQPIVDLMHYGTPLWLENAFANASYPQRVAEYAHAVAERYGDLIRFYTPLNEPTVNAEFCGRRGEWPPYLEGDDGYVQVLLQIARGMALTAAAVRQADPDAVLVQVEAMGWLWTAEPALLPEVEERMAHNTLAFDLATGGVDTSHLLWPFLRQHGVSEADLEWLKAHAASMDILGVNLYPWSGGELARGADGRVRRQGELNGYHLTDVLRQAWRRYGLPLMVTETSARRDVAGRAQWMDETIAAVRATGSDGIPVVGYTWFPAVSMIDWAYRTDGRAIEEHLLHLGLWDSAFDEDGLLQRQPTSLVEKYRRYVLEGDGETRKIEGTREVSAQAAARHRLSLDGQWQFWMDEKDSLWFDRLPPDRCLHVAVPAPWQSQAAGLRAYTGPAWYRRTIELAAGGGDGRLILGFGAVDYQAEVWFNGQWMGKHEGGYLPFEWDVTEAAWPGPNEIVVRVTDPAELFAEVPHGKQSWYGPLSGIWQPVWLEQRPATHWQGVKITAQGEAVTVAARLNRPLAADERVLFEIISPEGEVCAQAETPATTGVLTVANPRLWDVDSPHLYQARVTLLGDGASDWLSDAFGFRTIAAKDGQLWLNGRPIYLRGALDQDYYPDLIYTPPSLEWIEAQFRQAKGMGLNCLRVHLKVADPRYYEAADRVGLLIWTEVPNWDHLSAAAQARGRATLAGMIERDWNHPSIIIWTIINEAWGTEMATNPDHRAWLADVITWARQLDPTRLFVDNSPCFPNFHVDSDVDDFHYYAAMPDGREHWNRWVAAFADRAEWLYAPEYQANRHKRAPLVVSEFGNWGLPDLGSRLAHDGSEPWWFETGWDWGGGDVYPHGAAERFYALHLDKVFGDTAGLAHASQWAQYEALKYEIEAIRRRPEIAGYVITEFTDLHWEGNGLLDLWRKPKVYDERLAGLNAATVIVPSVGRWAWWAGETMTVGLTVSHFGRRAILQASLAWSLAGAGLPETAGVVNLIALEPAQVIELPPLALSVPAVITPQRAYLQLSLRDEAGTIVARNDVALSLFPPPAAPSLALACPDEKVAAQLQAAGYTVVAGGRGEEAVPLVLTTLDDSGRRFVEQGGRVLFLAESPDALQCRMPRLALQARAGTPWAGDWVSTLAWYRRDQWGQQLPGDGRLDFTFASVIPQTVITSARTRDYEGEVLAGVFAGWLRRPAALAQKMAVGRGVLLVSTLRLAETVTTDPVAAVLFQEHLRLL